MSTWQEEFRRSLLDYLVRKGTPVGADASVYGWIDGDYEEIREHFASCGISCAQSTYEDSRWTEFGGTFAESDTERTGIDAVVTCNCGRYEGKHFRYTGGYAAMITEITRD